MLNLIVNLNSLRPYHTTLGPASGPTCSKILAPPLRGTPANSCIRLIFPETRVIGLHFCRWWYVYLHSFSRGCLPKMRTIAKFRENLNL